MFYQDYMIKKVITIILLFLTLAGCEEEVEQGASSPMIQRHNCPLKQQAGKNVPEIHEVNLFITPPGAFNFSYNTYTAKDKITVTYEGKELLNTGCVGKSESKLLILPENPKADKGEGVSSKIIVSVEPNCQGNENDTEWLFTVDCPKCNFGSSDNDPQRCFGGIGARCRNDTPLAPKTYDYVNCTVEGFMSVGSILHDDCCLRNPNGWNCKKFKFALESAPRGETCGEEWQEAWDNTTMCSRCTAGIAGAIVGHPELLLLCANPRHWKVRFGTYPYVNTNNGDPLVKKKVPKGQKIDPKYQYLCSGGTCTTVGSDLCGGYCLCD